jgi:23S rRNA (pseudouridine1915-N3)-methyltransferase
MKIHFFLCWGKSRKIYKNTACEALSHEYMKRIQGFTELEFVHGNFDDIQKRRQSLGARLWVLERSKKSKILSSEDLSATLSRLLDQGQRHLMVVVGPPDGFRVEEIEAMKADLLWSFGPLTLPHELASVVAVEQLYRAFTIIKKHPYHLGH